MPELILTPLTFVEPATPGVASLLDQARNGDVEAFGAICRTYETPLLRHALALCGNSAMAEDLAQDTLVEAWKSLHHFNGRCQFFTWLCAILLNRYRNTVREKRPFPFSAFTTEKRDALQNNLAQSVVREAGPDEAAIHREQAENLRRCIAALPPKHRQVIHLRFYVDDSIEGIAAALGCSTGTVKSRLFHALEKLRRMNAMASELASPSLKGDSL